MTDSGWPASPAAVWSQTRNPDGSRTLVTWAPELPADARQGILDGMSEIVPAKPKRQSKPTSARAAYERHGAHNLLDEFDPPSRARKFVARFYYVSAGGEILCFDTQPLTFVSAEHAVEGHKMREVYNPRWSKRGKESMYVNGPPVSDAYDAEIVKLEDLETHATKHGARLVVLPSQRREPVETLRAESEDVDLFSSVLDNWEQSA